MITKFAWPDMQAILSKLTKLMADAGHDLKVRDADALEAGVSRAIMAEDYKDDADAAAIAALLFEGLATRHPLLDGNKRLAFTAMAAFLFLNGIRLDATEMDAYDMSMAVIKGDKSTDDLAEFIRMNSYREEG